MEEKQSDIQENQTALSNKQKVSPSSVESVDEEGDWHCDGMSIRTKILSLLTAALFLFGFASAAISYSIYMDSSIEQHKYLGESTARLVSSVIDADKVDEYIEKGPLAEGYLEKEKQLYQIKNSSPAIEYLYVYKIMEDGCHVVFDLDSEGAEGSKPGEVIEFDEAFKEYLPTLLAGGNVAPIISDETYGWLLTVYVPVYDSQGSCKCYAAVDISMNDLRLQAQQFLVKLCVVFSCIFIVILLAAFWLAKYNLIIPINKMARSASRFRRDNVEALKQSLSEIRKLDIHTEDEIENLYRSFVTMTQENVNFMTDIHQKTQTISELQKAFILTMADMVERRDQNTGEHIKKTAAYVKIIAEEMKREGAYPKEITDEFVRRIVDSAPLHDLGKIGVPDAILNKPGKLTDEEFDIIKSHTKIGGRIISSLISAVPDSEYLYDAMDLALYHHEKWNGRGYPMGLSGEDIPISARIMAVADVFDALVSNRSYKKGFPYEKALAIIREERGAHFDPIVVDAFFAVKDEILKVADEFSEQKTPMAEE
ncbi:MAG: HD domain-containing protein [Selenomonadaceae bacterium]|nr:HD domain-containing protein [Selenomonadaceae bacterium]